MCGIVGYIGPQEACPILMEGLSRLSYRGYDSAGVAVLDADGKINIHKAKGRLENLASILETHPLYGKAGIGHTRWATHDPAAGTSRYNYPASRRQRNKRHLQLQSMSGRFPRLRKATVRCRRYSRPRPHPADRCHSRRQRTHRSAWTMEASPR